MFRRILIANRGEIAVRVIRACREMGIESVAVYSDADARARHVVEADHAVRLGPAPATESYLSTSAIVRAAHDLRAEAVHPGYGFLSESAVFARACRDAGLVFIGPPPEAVERMASKTAARALAVEAQVPVVPGIVPRDQSDPAIDDAARALGFPLLLKPAAGGGGIGMKTVRDGSILLQTVAQARREAQAAFGDATLYLERLVGRPRHVEVQVMGDAQGRIVHLFERECSVQRRHQKVLEETPCVALSPALRAEMGAAAVRVASAAGYQNAGTVEFLLEGRGNEARFYFLEMNTRLQVEHPITEQVVGVDLVRAQIEIAAGDPLPWSQDQLTQRGHAIEVRVYAEDPQTGYMPQAGHLLLYREPAMPGVRVDSGFSEGGDIPVHYDPLIAKLIATAETREAARRRLLSALRAFPILGVRTNVSLLSRVLEHEAFVRGKLDTGFLEREVQSLTRPAAPPADLLALAAAIRRAGTQADSSEAANHHAIDPWDMLRSHRV